MNYNNIPLYTASRYVDIAFRDIEKPPTKDKNGKPNYLEHHVSTWMGTMLKKVFQSDDLSLGAEVIDVNTGNKPDYLIKKLDEKDELIPHLYVELKKTGGDHFEKALDQATNYLQKTIEERSEEIKECFIVVQRGVHIGFFEYHARHEDLKDIPNFRNCTSLTQIMDTGEDNPYVSDDRPPDWNQDQYKNLHTDIRPHAQFNQDFQRVILPNIPLDLQEISYGKYRGKNPDLVKIHNDAKGYTQPCVFNVQQHKREIDYLFHYIAMQNARVIVPEP